VVAEVALGALLFRDEIRILRLRTRLGLRSQDRGLMGSVGGFQLVVPNIRNANEDTLIQVHVGVPVGHVEQVGAPDQGFRGAFAYRGRVDIQYGVWSEQAEVDALDLARLGVFAASGDILALTLPHRHRFRMADQAIADLVGLAHTLRANAGTIEGQLARRLQSDAIHARLGGLEGQLHRRIADREVAHSVLSSALAWKDPALLAWAARIIVSYPVADETLALLASRAGKEWPKAVDADAASMGAYFGDVARAAFRVGMPEARAIAWLGAPYGEVIERTLAHLGETGGVESAKAIRAFLDRRPRRVLRNAARAAGVKIRERLLVIGGEGHLAVAELLGGEIEEAVEAGAIAEAQE
jgi:hypothetical protein